MSIKEDILKTVEELLDDSIAIVDRANEDELMGKLVNLGTRVETDPTALAALELAILARVAVLYDK